jgi:hypothetical protein
VSEETDQQKVLGEIKIDKDNLYKEEVVTDLRVATLRRLTPIKVDGSDDESRPVLYMGETQLMSARGPLPIQCPIEAGSLEEAIDAFPDAVNVAVENMIEEAKEMQRQEASRIVVPGQPSGSNKLVMG